MKPLKDVAARPEQTGRDISRAALKSSSKEVKTGCPLDGGKAMRPATAEKVAGSYAILEQAMAEHGPSHVFGMFSGGHDSLCATHLVSQFRGFDGAVHINTGIGIRQTREFVCETARERQWKLREYTPPVSYRDIVLEHGFPGPGAHFFAYVRLKERCVRFLVRETKQGPRDRIGLVTGVRLSESVRRMGHVEAIQREGAKLWVAPILHWDDDDKNDYMAHHGLTRNPVVDTICMSGECLCGAFASPNEIIDIEASYPEMAAEIRALEADVAAAGKHAVWGTRPPGSREKPSKSGMMCSSCQLRLPFEPEAA